MSHCASSRIRASGERSPLSTESGSWGGGLQAWLYVHAASCGEAVSSPPCMGPLSCEVDPHKVLAPFCLCLPTCCQWLQGRGVSSGCGPLSASWPSSVHLPASCLAQVGNVCFTHCENIASFLWVCVQDLSQTPAQTPTREPEAGSASVLIRNSGPVLFWLLRRNHWHWGGIPGETPKATRQRHDARGRGSSWLLGHPRALEPAP